MTERIADRHGFGFLKLMRGGKTEALMGDPKAFTLVSWIAIRAQRTDSFNPHGLRPGEALLGDHRTYGMTAGEYREARKRLSRWQIATFRRTNKGTIASLVDETVYDINAEPNSKPHDKQTTSQQQANYKPTTTTKNARREKGKKEDSLSERAVELAQFFVEQVRKHNPTFKPPHDIHAWERVLDEMIRADGRAAEQIQRVIEYAQQNSFWRTRAMNPTNLRKHFDVLAGQLTEGAEKLPPCVCCGGPALATGIDDTGKKYGWCARCQPERAEKLREQRGSAA